jgi:hypothetical protein
VNIGDRARVNGIVSRDDVRVGRNATVDGNIKAGGSAFVSRSARVTGTVRSHAPFGPTTTIEWSVDAGSTNAGPVTVAPGAVLDLPPVKIPRFCGHPNWRENAPGVIHGQAKEAA